MLVREKDRIELWIDSMRKGTAKECFLLGSISSVLFIILFMISKPNYAIPETYMFLGILLLPCFGLILLGLIFLKKEKITRLEAVITKEYIELYKKHKTKKIYFDSITKIELINSSYGSVVIIYHKENEKNKKYQFVISAANLGLIEIAIKEYNDKINIERKNV